MSSDDHIAIKRVYESPSTADGTRVLVDRLWPRGVSKARAALDEWLKDVAPSPELRTWWNHDPARFEEFRRRYEAELDSDPVHAAAVEHLVTLARAGRLTLVYAARGPINHAQVLADHLRGLLRDQRG